MLTLDQLKRREFALANRCCFCEQEEETVEHLVRCQKVRPSWGLFLNVVGSAGLPLFSFVRFSSCGKGHEWVKSVKKFGRQPPLCIFWTIWHERNRVIFENIEFCVNWIRGPS